MNRMVNPDECAISPLRDGREPVAKRKKVLPAKPKIDLLERNTASLKTPSSCKVWSILECEQVIASYTNPIGKVTITDNKVPISKLNRLITVPQRNEYISRTSSSLESYALPHGNA